MLIVELYFSKMSIQKAKTLPIYVFVVKPLSLRGRILLKIKLCFSCLCLC
jgi:hypothetical protein